MSSYIKTAIIVFLSCLCQQVFAQYNDYKLSTLEYVCEYEDDAEHSDAQNELAIRYKNGVRGATQNNNKAFYWFTKSAKNGNKYAMNNLAYCYLEGKGTAKDLNQAVYWMEESAKRYFPTASATIGRWYLFGQNTAKNYSKAVRYLKDAAFGEDGQSMSNLAYCYLNGYGVEPNAEFVKFWANRAVDKEVYLAYFLLGNMYIEGKITPKNELQAYVNMTLGKDHNVSACTNGVGRMYEEGFFFDQDFLKAEENYILAAKQGSSAAIDNLNSLAYRYAEGDGIRKDLDKALSIINKAIDMSDDKEYYLDSKGEFYLMMGRNDDARRVWQQIIRNKPNFYKDYINENDEDTVLNKYMTSH